MSSTVLNIPHVMPATIEECVIVSQAILATQVTAAAAAHCPATSAKMMSNVRKPIVVRLRAMCASVWLCVTQHAVALALCVWPIIMWHSASVHLGNSLGTPTILCRAAALLFASKMKTALQTRHATDSIIHVMMSVLMLAGKMQSA